MKKIIKLFDILIFKTIANQVNWQKSSGENSYSLILDSGAIDIDSALKENTHFFEIKILNKTGDIVTIYDISYEKDEVMYNYLKNFHRVITYSYYKVDELIKDMMEEIRTVNIIGS